jgi:hypothetical protein
MAQGQVYAEIFSLLNTNRLDPVALNRLKNQSANNLLKAEKGEEIFTLKRAINTLDFLICNSKKNKQAVAS